MKIEKSQNKCPNCDEITDFVIYDAIEIYKIGNRSVSVPVKNIEKCLKCGEVLVDDERDSLIAEYIMGIIDDDDASGSHSELEEGL